MNDNEPMEIKSLKSVNNKQTVTTYEEALDTCGFGLYHLRLLCLCGWAVSSDAIEVLSISFVLPSATCDLNLTSSDKGLINSIVFLGMLIGGYVWGSLADKWGRRNILVWSLLLNATANVSSSFVHSFGWFMACRMVSGIGVGGSMPVIFTYYTEFQHKKRRGAMISLLATFWMAGNMVAAGLAWIIIPREYLSFTSGGYDYHSWRIFVAMCSLPALSSAAMFVLMPESPKFLLQIGRSLDAVSVLQKVHKSNKSKHPFNIENLILTDETDPDRSNSLVETRMTGQGVCQRTMRIVVRMLQSTLMLFNKTLRRRTLVLWVVNFSLAFGYYGLFMWFPTLFHRIDKYGGSFCDMKTGSDSNTTKDCSTPSQDVFLESFLTSISNLPGNILTFIVVERIGRKPLLAGSMTLSGLSVFGLYFIKKKWENVFMSCLFGAISVIGFNMIDCLLVELFPTKVRSTSFGLQMMATRIGAILGNVIFGYMIDVHCAIPMLLVAGLLSFGGIISLLLPKTTGVDIH